MTTQAMTQTNGAAVQRAQPQSPVARFAEFLEKRKPELAKVMASVLTPERVTKVAIAAFAKSPDLQQCSLQSVYEAVHQSVQLGLEPGGPLGHAYLVPYNGTCTLIPGYKGLIALARRSKEIKSISAHVVYAHDTFELAYGLEEKLVHVPFLDGDRGAPRFVYAVAQLVGGGAQLEVLTVHEVNKIRDGSPASKSKKSPWHNHWDEMARKTAIRRLAKYLPLTVELADALAVEDDAIDTTAVQGAIAQTKPAAGARIVAALQDDEPAAPSPPDAAAAVDEAPPHDAVTGEVLPAQPAQGEIRVAEPVAEKRAAVKPGAQLVAMFREAADAAAFDVADEKFRELSGALPPVERGKAIDERMKAIDRLGIK